MEVSVADEHLQNAVVESWRTGSLIPLLKEELKLRIQTKRLSEGKNELVADFSPHPKHPLGPDETRRKEDRKEQNRRAADRFRQKKKLQLHQLHATLLELDKKNGELKANVASLLEEKNVLLLQLMALVKQTDGQLDKRKKHQRTA